MGIGHAQVTQEAAAAAIFASPRGRSLTIVRDEGAIQKAKLVLALAKHASYTINKLLRLKRWTGFVSVPLHPGGTKTNQPPEKRGTSPKEEEEPNFFSAEGLKKEFALLKKGEGVRAAPSNLKRSGASHSRAPTPCAGDVRVHRRRQAGRRPKQPRSADSADGAGGGGVRRGQDGGEPNLWAASCDGRPE